MLWREVKCPACSSLARVNHDDRSGRPSALRGIYLWSCPACRKEVKTPCPRVGTTDRPSGQYVTAYLV